CIFLIPHSSFRVSVRHLPGPSRSSSTRARDGPPSTARGQYWRQRPSSRVNHGEDHAAAAPPAEVPNSLIFLRTHNHGKPG
ncbi:MAG: hypothetical protein AVDCRST_MAG64-3792, partial [uncultured Phycisphaerae bacterium]